MTNAQIGMAVLAIILIVIGAWPIAIIPLIALILMRINRPKEQKDKTADNEIEELKKRIEDLEKGR